MAIDVEYVIFSLDAYNKHKINSLFGYVIESPLVNFALPFIPGKFNFVVSVMLIGLGETEGCNMRFIIDKDGTPIADTGNLEVKPERQETHSYIPKEFTPRFLSFKLANIDFQNEGGHSYTVMINDTIKKTGKIGVFQIPRGGN